MSDLYVQYGCGFSVGEGWLNFDSSPTLRIERLPLAGPALARLSGNKQKFPAAVKYGDICNGLPVAPGSARGAYASHVLEHLSYNDFRKALKHTYDILAPGGIFRLIVPDLQERARRYLDDASNGSPDANSHFMRRTHLGLEERPESLLGRVRLLIGGSQHLWMWDEPSMAHQLETAGFVSIRRCGFGDSDDEMFSRVENTDRFVDQTLKITELAMEARKPTR